MRALIGILFFLLFTQPVLANREGDYDCRTTLQKLVDHAKQGAEERLYHVRSGLAVKWHSFKKRFTKPADTTPKPGYPQGGASALAHNKDTEGAKTQAARESVASIEGIDAGLWTQAYLSDLDPDTGVMRAGRAKRVDIRIERNVETTEVALGFGRTKPAVGDLALIPAGYEPVGDRSMAMLSLDSQGNARFINVARDAFDIAPTAPRALSKAQRKMYTAIRHIPLRLWPSWMQSEIVRLKQTGGSATAIAGELSRLISNQLLYSVDATDSMGALALAHSGAAQCDGAALILASILRDQFGIATRVVVGYQGFSADGRSHVISPSIGHAWVEIYDPATQRWVLFDPTPLRKTRETTDPPAQDGFSPIGKQNESSSGQKEQQESSHPQDGKQESKSKAQPKQNSAEAFAVATWENALGAYSNSKDLAARLREAAEAARKQNSKPQRELAEKADRLLMDLAVPSNHYSSLDQIPQGDQRRMSVLRDVLRLLSDVRKLSEPERALLHALNENTEAMGMNAKNKKAQIDALNEQLGATGRVVLAEKIREEGTLSPDNAKKLALIGAVRSLVNLDFTPETTFEKQPSKRSLNQRNPERPVVFRTMDDLSNLQHAVRDGQPMENDIPRFLRDDLLEVTNIDRRRAPPTVEVTPKTSVIVISDQSPSMDDMKFRALVRDAAILAVTDTPGLDNVLEINFGGVVEQAIRIGPEPELAKEAFLRRMSTTGSIPATDIGAAVSHGFQAAKTMESNHITIVLLTDGSGAWSPSAYETEKAELEEKGVRVDFKVVFFGGGNPQIKKAAEETASHEGEATHITFTDNRLKKIESDLNERLKNPAPQFFRVSDEAKRNLARAVAAAQAKQIGRTDAEWDVLRQSSLPLPSKPVPLPELPEIAQSERSAFAKTYFENIAVQMRSDFRSALAQLSASDRYRLASWLRGGR